MNPNESRDEAAETGNGQPPAGGNGNQLGGESGSDDEPWPLKEPRELLSDRRLRLPALAEERIAGDGEAPRVAWNYDSESEFVFISASPARKSAYTFADMSRVYDAGGEYPKIRAPDALPTAIKERFDVEGTFMVYLANEDMLTDENPSAWLLSWTQLMRILPEEGGNEDVEALIARNPGFMPSSPF